VPTCLGGANLLVRTHVRKIHLVELYDGGRRLWIQPVGAHVFDHVAPRLVVRLGRAALRVRDECDRIRALQYEPASRGMHDLAGYGEELDLHLESAPAL